MSAPGTAAASAPAAAVEWASLLPAAALPTLTPAVVRTALDQLATAVGHSLDDPAFAHAADRADALAAFRSEFRVPRAAAIAAAIAHGEESTHPSHPIDPEAPCVYLCGNSLGLLPSAAEQYVSEELSKWSSLGVEGHFAGARPWARVDEQPTALSMQVVGAALEAEVAIMNSLSVNLHLLLTSFYRPAGRRSRVLMEADAFCSDHHVVRSQVELHGRAVDQEIIAMKPRAGESTLRTEDIVQAIREAGDTLALVMLPGVQFYTGQLFDIEAITAAGHAVGAYVGWDLAHAVGNVPLRLHAWGVDFAAWCSYKYLNSGPGAIAGAFVHERHFAADMPKLKGWWGQTPQQRFAMQPVHVEKPGAQAYMLSNPAVLPTVCMQASLELHNRAGQVEMRRKSVLLTAYLERLLKERVGALGDEDPAQPADAQQQADPRAPVTVRILTPSLPSARGCQLSLLFSTPARALHRALSRHGVVTDVREPNVIRVSPTPLYNTFADVREFVDRLQKVLGEANEKRQHAQ